MDILNKEDWQQDVDQTKKDIREGWDYVSDEKRGEGDQQVPTEADNHEEAQEAENEPEDETP
jgi:hypothetical protein